MRPMAFIAGPFGATTDNPDIQKNIARAEALGALAVKMGFTPIVVHSYGFAVHAPDLVTYDQEPAQARQSALECSRDLVAQLAKFFTAQFLGIRNADGTLSSGVQMEVNTFLGNGGHTRRACVHTWSDWKPSFVGAGLEDLWASLV